MSRARKRTLAEVRPLATLDDVLRYLRALEGPCVPPVGVGTFDLLCASERHILVWYSPAREEHRAGEHTIPTPRLAAAWRALRANARLDEPALTHLAGSPALARWLLALLALLPGVHLCMDAPATLELAEVGAPSSVTPDASSLTRRD